jgi:hypothetical protein
MQTATERAGTVGDKFIELYMRRAEACGQEDLHRVRRLEDELRTQLRGAVMAEDKNPEAAG